MRDDLELMAEAYDDIGEIPSDEVYIKREVMNFRPVYCVYNAEGELLARANSRSEAFLMTRQNDLIPQDVQ